VLEHPLRLFAYSNSATITPLSVADDTANPELGG
jgi:hypothetical protein